MSAEAVSVSLSRLALAKAIKTPDANEEEAEPWSKSIIFHQSHIDDQMRNSILNPSSNKNRRRPHNQPLLKQQNRASPMNRSRPEDQYRSNRQAIHKQQQSNTAALNHTQGSSSSSSGNSSLSSGKLVQKQNIKPGRRYIPSDDEEEDDDDEDSEDDEEDNEIKQPIIKPQNQKVNNTIEAVKPIKTRTIEPSDDEDSSSSDKSSNKEKGKKLLQNDDNTEARRMSTLRQLEQGASIWKSKSTDESMTIPSPDAFVEPIMAPMIDAKLGTIEQWRMTVMEADDLTSLSTPGSIQSFNEEEDAVMYRQSPAGSLRQHKNGPSSQSKRTSTMNEMDMLYLQQQQQQLYNMQLQKAMQMQQAQQMLQIQQYQQAAMQQYRDPMIMDNRQNNRKPHKSKTSSRLLSNVPEHGMVNDHRHRSHQRRSQMMHNGPPMPTISMSTPVHHYTRHPQQTAMLPPSSTMVPPAMKASRSSHMSKRASTFQYK